MNFFRNISLSRKQMLIVMLTSGVALVTACGGFLGYEILMFRQQMVRNLSLLTQIIGDNSTAGLEFSDGKAVEDTLAALRADPHIMAAAVYAKDGKLFAVYERMGIGPQFKMPKIQPDGWEFKRNSLVLFQPVRSKGEKVGTVYVESDLGELGSRLREYVLIVLGVLGAACMVAFMLSSWLQRIISGPILRLVETTRSISSHRNYSVRAVKQSNDELGALVESFNEMLSQIQTRDAELEKSKAALEQRVQERTAELASANTALQRENHEREQAEKRLRRTEELYRRAIEGAEAVPYAYDYKTRTYHFIGEGIEKLIGYKTGEMSPALWDKIIQESVMLGETAGLSKEEAMRRVKSGELRAWRCDMRVLTRDGKMRWLADASIQNLDESGRPTGSMGILHDITERKQAEKSLRLLSSAIEQSADNVVITDASGKIEYVNPAFVQLTGYAREELLDQNTRLLQSGRHGAEFYKNLWETILGGKSFRAEFTNRKKDGELFYEEKILTPVLDSAGKIAHFVGSGRDVTDRKKAEAEMESLNRQLLDVSRRAGMAEVATGVLHNVGNILNSVNVTATLVEDQLRASRVSDVARLAALFQSQNGSLDHFLTEDPKGRKIPKFLSQLAQRLEEEQAVALKELESLRRNVEHIKEIVSVQQSYAKVSGFAESLDARDLIEDALRMNSAALARHGVEVIRDFHAAPPVNTDRHKVLQILVNLIRNAKYACDDSGRAEKLITLRVAHLDERLQISVLDNGIGIPPENLTRIFNHGFTTRKDGHGFGLHSGANAARELGGELTVYSEGHDKGACFTLKLPCTSSEPAAPVSSQEISAKAQH